MSTKRLDALTTDDVTRLLEQLSNGEHQIEAADVVIIPPKTNSSMDAADLDEDENEESSMNDVKGPFELHITEDEPKNGVASSETSVPHGAKKRKLGYSEPQWVKKHPEYTKNLTRTTSHVEAFLKMKESLQHCSPLEVFHQLITAETYDHMVDECIQYCSSREILFDPPSVDEVKAFLGVIMFSSYCKLPNSRHYWSNEEDLGQTIIKKAMARNRFHQLKGILNFYDIEEVASLKPSKGYNICSLMKMLRTSFQKYGIFDENLSVDQLFVNCTGRDRMKQSIRGKPIRFGYKLWALCGSSGYCYNFDLYCGKSEHDGSHDDVSLDRRVVFQLLDFVPDPRSHCVFLDKSFTSHDLLVRLRDIGYQATGLVGDSRMRKCPLIESSSADENSRGSYDYSFDTVNEILFVRSIDDNPVTIGTNYDSIDPVTSVVRWSKYSKVRGPVVQPHVVKTHESCSDGVHKHVCLVSKYTSSIGSKKWYWPLFVRLLDMTVVNAWIIYQLIHDGDGVVKSLLDFRRYICISYLKSTAVRNSPLKTLSPTSKPIDDVRFDLKGHVIAKRDKQRRCQNDACYGKPRTYCQKCNVTLCLTCFAPYHRA